MAYECSGATSLSSGVNSKRRNASLTRPLFELHVDSRPSTQQTASARYENPTLFENGR